MSSTPARLGLNYSAQPRLEVSRLESGVYYMRVTGDLVFQHHDFLVAELEKNPIKEGLIIDLSKCRFVDSTTVGLFVKLHKAVQQRHGRFGLIVPEGIIRRSLEISRLDQVLKLYPDLATAQSAWHQPAA